MNEELTAIDKVLARKWAFLGMFFITFSLSYGLLYIVDFLPEPKTVESHSGIENTSNAATSTDIVVESEISAVRSLSNEVFVSGDGNQTGETMPERLTIPSLGREVAVLNPSSRTVSVLDNALLTGVVRHPDSAALGQEGNVFILGHSSYLPNVLNRNFQAFNGIQNLVWGDSITLESNGIEYIYQVKKVYKTKASDATVPIAGVGKRLTLATCNSFGSKDDRYIVEADFVESRPL